MLCCRFFLPKSRCLNEVKQSAWWWRAAVQLPSLIFTSLTMHHLYTLLLSKPWIRRCSYHNPGVVMFWGTLVHWPPSLCVSSKHNHIWQGQSWKEGGGSSPPLGTLPTVCSLGLFPPTLPWPPPQNGVALFLSVYLICFFLKHFLLLQFSASLGFLQQDEGK